MHNLNSIIKEDLSSMLSLLFGSIVTMLISSIKFINLSGIMSKMDAHQILFINFSTISLESYNLSMFIKLSKFSPNLSWLTLNNFFKNIFQTPTKLKVILANLNSWKFSVKWVILWLVISTANYSSKHTPKYLYKFINFLYPSLRYSAKMETTTIQKTLLLFLRKQWISILNPISSLFQK